LLVDQFFWKTFYRPDASVFGPGELVLINQQVSYLLGAKS
jgi:hypothetical protein